MLRDTRAENQKLRTELGKSEAGEPVPQDGAVNSRPRQGPRGIRSAYAVKNGRRAGHRHRQPAVPNTAVFVDRGSTSGVQKGMAVVTPDGIVGKVLAAYPTASQVLLVTDPSFAAGVVSQKNHVRGILKGMGHGNCRVDYVQNEEKVETGGVVLHLRRRPDLSQGHASGTGDGGARPGSPFQEITVDPSGMAGWPGRSAHHPARAFIRRFRS